MTLLPGVQLAGVVTRFLSPVCPYALTSNTRAREKEGAHLKRVDDAKDFIELTAGGRGVRQRQPDLLSRVDDENAADREGDALRPQ